MVIAKQNLMVFKGTEVEIVEPDTVCPECGMPWKEGAEYGHKICCGCPTCGYSMCVFDASVDEIIN